MLYNKILYYAGMRTSMTVLDPEDCLRTRNCGLGLVHDVLEPMPGIMHDYTVPRRLTPLHTTWNLATVQR